MDEREICAKVHDFFDRYTDAWAGSLEDIEDAMVALILSIINEKKEARNE